MFEKILVCLDGSKLAEQILPLAKAQAKKFNSQVVLLQVVHLPTISIVEAGATYNDPKLMAEQEKINFEKAKVYLESINLNFRSQDIPVESIVIKDFSVGKAILNYAITNGISLIAIATHGHGGLGRLVFGSVAEYILRESGLPMLVIRPKTI